ncbi:MAG: ABC transporter ATP-binding protein [Candidatus Altarchaeaceae archaeon]
MSDEKSNEKTENYPIIECRNLTKKFGEFTAVDNLNLTINRGEIFAFVGPNGAGKTTTMNMLVGLIEPTSGEAIIDGKSVIKDPIGVKKIIGFLPENVSLYPTLTARQNVRYIANLNGINNEEKIDKVLEIVGLENVKDKKVGEFSKGMRQRVGVACVLVKDPKVIFLDEPTSGLDPTGKIEFQGMLKKLKEDGITIFYSSHILGEVKGVADRAGILHKGKLEKILNKNEIENIEKFYKEITGIA